MLSTTAASYAAYNNTDTGYINKPTTARKTPPKQHKSATKKSQQQEPSSEESKSGSGSSSSSSVKKKKVTKLTPNHRHRQSAKTVQHHDRYHNDPTENGSDTAQDTTNQDQSNAEYHDSMDSTQRRERISENEMNRKKDFVMTPLSKRSTLY